MQAERLADNSELAAGKKLIARELKMHTFSVNPDKCISCGQCVADCLASVLEMRDGNPLFAKPESCIGCLHCFAICPVGAISMDGYEPDQEPPMEDIPAAKSVDAFIRQRRSIRSFQQENIDPGTIRNMLELAWSAPSGVNQHLLQISVIDDMAAMDKFRREVYGHLRDLVASGKFNNEYLLKSLGSSPDNWLKEDKVLRGAPHMVAVSYAKNAATGSQDAIIYLSYLEFLARSMGFATLWCGFMYLLMRFMPELKTPLGIPDDYEFGYPMLLGKTDIHYSRGFERRGAKIYVVR